MPANTQPIWSRAPAVAWAEVVLGPSAMTTADGTGSAIFPVWQAHATEGGFIRSLRARVCTPTLTIASLMRAYICSVTGAFTAGVSNTIENTWLFDEIVLPAAQVLVTPSVPIEMQFGFALDPGYRVLVSFHTSTGAAGVGWRVGALAGRY